MHTFDPSRKRDVLSRYQEIETEHSKNSLHLAAKLGNLEAVQDLLGKGANVNAQNDTGKTPLHWAAREGHKQVVQALLDKGANVNAEDQDGETSLDLATNQDIETLLRNTAKLLKVAKSGDIQEVNSLINKGANVNATDQDGKTPLHWAAVKGHEEVVEALLGKHGIDVNLADKNKDTPLHSVLKKDNIDINVLNALLRAEGINVNAQDKDNRTPLHWATGRDNVEVVNVLIIKGADVNAQDKDNRTPLHFAAQNNNKEIVDALIKAGADVNIKDEDGKTPLDLTTNEEIKTLLQPAEESDDGSVGEPATDSEGGQEEEEEEEDSNQSQREQDINGEKGADVQDNDVGPVASTEPAQTEEQPSSFFGSLFSILMKPFSLIGSFFSDFFSWLFGSNTDESTSQTDASVSLLRSDSLDEEDSSGGHYSAMNTDV
ncbi:ankyrin repeat domain-containing protein [Wolbachia endosymbiont (group A) of Ophion costatus]|uniref:ankyrin repeat domain-containing protein n=1 Tax=Wolbachia endosymbiont (group A) of Ophion costatus TaxID=3066209 RepID=UPI0030CC2C95